MTDAARKFIVTVGYTGLVPVAPGTAGTLATACVLLGLLTLTRQWDAGYWIAQAIILGVGLIASILCVQNGDWAIFQFGRKDPGPCVIDETAGFCITLLFLPITTQGWWLTVLCAFVGFRVFDVLKPPPARRLERLPAGWGILMDDLMAGVYASVACQIVLRVVF